MGFNYPACGFSTVRDFAEAHRAGADEQLAAFVQFIDRPPFRDALRTKDWAVFAAAYNGPDYAKNQYNIRLATAYSQHCE
ncbi:DUF3380 domain-containing protein, partial [Pseudomonas chlororaphis]